MTRAPNGDLQILYRSLSPARRKQLLIVALLMPVTAVAEMLMIAAIVPFLSALIPGGNPDTVLAGPLARLERLWPAHAMVVAATLFIPVVIVTSALRLTLTWKSLRFSADLGHDLNMGIQRRMLHQPYLFHVSGHCRPFTPCLTIWRLPATSLAINGRAIAAASSSERGRPSR